MKYRGKKIPAEQGSVGYRRPPVATRFKPGRSGNPAGRPKSAGLSIREWLNQMQDWPRTGIQEVLDDEDAPVNKRTAARIWIDATSKDKTNSGMPIAGPDADRIMDRTDGKPISHLDVTSGLKEINFTLNIGSPTGSDEPSAN